MEMAGSPMVDPNQRRITQNRENSTPEQSLFNKKFGDKAYQTVTSKFPKLLDRIVTFKIIESDPTRGFSIGAFIVRSGADVRYIPVIMTDGEIVSAEMIYDKGEDTLIPMTSDVVNDIINADLLSSETLVDNPMVENTQKVFRDMYRPPTRHMTFSSNQVDIAALPNRHKKALSDFFTNNPQVLAKVAQFYPVEVLASRLAPTKTAVAQAEEPTSALADVIKLSDLTEKVAAQLSADEKKSVVEHGYLIRKEGSLNAIATKGLAGNMETQLKLISRTKDVALFGTGVVYSVGSDDVIPEPCVVADGVIITAKGVKRGLDKDVVIGDFSEGLTREALLAYGAQPPETFKVHERFTQDGYSETIWVFYPTKNGTYRVFTPDKLQEDSAKPSGCTVGYGSTSFYAGDHEVKKINGDVVLSSKWDSGYSIGFIDQIKAGYARVSDKEAMLPKDSLLVQLKADITPYITNMQTLIRLFKNSGTLVKLLDNGAGITVTDSFNQKTASFTKVSDAVEYLVHKCRFSKIAVDRLLKDKEVLILEKKAFYERAPQEEPESAEAADQGLYSTGFAPDQMAEQGPVEVDEEMLTEISGIEDEDLMNTGMLAAVAGNDDIKATLVDMLPQFAETCTLLGRALLVFSVNRDDVEDFYGEEDYNTLLMSLRKIFKMLGELTTDLRKYTNM